MYTKLDRPKIKKLPPSASEGNIFNILVLVAIAAKEVWRFGGGKFGILGSVRQIFW